MSNKISQIFNCTSTLLFLTAVAIFLTPGCSEKQPTREKLVLTKEIRDTLSPQDILNALKEGNQDFVNGEWIDLDFTYEQKQTAAGQYPAAIILSCIDSRAPVEIIFNSGIGSLFNARVAGNFVNTDIDGSMEYACKVAGSKVIVVMGHTSCGAIKGAIDNVKLGNLTSLLKHIEPAIDAVQHIEGERNSKNKTFVNAVARKNVLLTIEKIRETSPVLKEMEDKGEIMIVGAMYHVETGKVDFFDTQGRQI